MTARTARVVVLLLATVAGLAGAGCSKDSAAEAAGTPGKKIAALPPTLVPAEVNGLRTGQEDLKPTFVGVRRSFVDATSLYTFRSGDLLQATLQVSRFTKDAAADRAAFHSSVVAQIGSTVPKPFRIGGDTVYLTSGKQQSIAVWFRDRYLFVLAVRQDYPQPRSLLRTALGFRP